MLAVDVEGVIASLPVRGEWIEICGGGYEHLPAFVSPREGRVD